MDSQKIYLLAELTVPPEFPDDVKGALKQALIPTPQEAVVKESSLNRTTRSGCLQHWRACWLEPRS